MTLYMHTLNDMPASFFTRSGVCFTNKRIRLATSLRQIRREQKLSREIHFPDNFKYGYVTVTGVALRGVHHG